MNPLTFAQLTPNLRLGIALMTLQVAWRVSVSVLAIVTPKIDVVTTHVAIFTFTVKIVVIIDVNIPAICFETNIAIIVAVAALVSVAPASRTSATTKILVNIDYVTTADIATDIHHSCSGFFDDAIIDNVLNAAPELIDTDATALVEASSTSVGSTVRAYTAQLTMVYVASTDSDSATFLNKTVAAVHDAAAVLQYEAVLTVYDSVVAAATTVTSTSITIVVAAVENVATAILVNIDSATATKIATGIHHGCSGFPDNVIVNNILIAAPPDLVDTDATAPVIMAGITSAGSTARPAYTTRLTIDRLSSTGSGSATVAAATTTATTATSASTTTAAVAAVDNAAISEFGIAADPFAVAVDVSSCAVSTEVFEVIRRMIHIRQRSRGLSHYQQT